MSDGADIGMDLERRRRRPVGPAVPVSGIPAATAPTTPAAVDDSRALVERVADDVSDVEEGHRFPRPHEQFEHWFQIYEAVQAEFRRRSRELTGQDHVNLEDEQEYYRLVSSTVEGRPDWAQPVALPNLVYLLRRHQFGYGGIEDYLEMDGIEEVYFNRFDDGFYKRGGAKYRINPPLFTAEKEMRDIIDRIALENKLSIDLAHPVLDARLKDGSRLNAIIPPVARLGTSLVIRKHREIPITIDDYIKSGFISEEAVKDLGRMVRGGFRIVVSGGTASGKAQPVDAKVLTPSGWKTMGEIELGSEVVNPQGGTARVVGVFPQGERDIYRVELASGAATECDLEHLWQVYASANERWELLTLREIVERRAVGEAFLVPLAKQVAIQPVTAGFAMQSVAERVAAVERFGQLLEDVDSSQVIVHQHRQPEVSPTTTKEIRAITAVGRRQARCIALDSANELYITDDFIVTHNTTVLNVIGNAFIPPEQRVIVLEETPELQIHTYDTQYLVTQKDASRDIKVEGDITLSDLIRYCLRMRPDRIIVGEVRGREAMDVLTAWNSGHEGSFLTLHANSAIDAMAKFEQLALSAEQFTQAGVRDLIGRVVDLVLQVEEIKRGPKQGQRRLREMIQVIHPGNIPSELKASFEEMIATGVVEPLWDGACYALPIYRLDPTGTLYKVNEPISFFGQEL